ncbi:MAG TPA: class I SAM-dependent methyltransferase [Candidatus Sulfotelmatobacter sp.]|nr:class I SAM-dependent methyltransferase [Candidatus Sulfotelmatobacter sp.]
MANVESMEISHRVYLLAKECPVSGNDSNALMEFHNLVAITQRGRGAWDSYKDKKVLDVCSGLSNFTARLLQMGADAYALDYGYQDVEELNIRSGRRPAGQFFESFLQNRDRYINGSVHNLPFDSETFDAVTSYYGIFGVVDDDVDLAYQSIDEAVRVLKLGGILSVGPLQSGQITTRQAAAEHTILGILGKRDDITTYVLTPERRAFFGSQDISRQGKLTVVKNAA